MIQRPAKGRFFLRGTDWIVAVPCDHKDCDGMAETTLDRLYFDDPAPMCLKCGWPSHLRYYEQQRVLEIKEDESKKRKEDPF